MLKILVVDDDIRVQRSLTALLEGHEVICRSSVKDAKYALVMNMVEPFDVIICDEAMPVEKGHTLINWCHENPIDSKLIMLTAVENDQEMLSKIKYIEDVSILNKPWDSKELLNLVTGVIGSRTETAA